MRGGERGRVAIARTDIAKSSSSLSFGLHERLPAGLGGGLGPKLSEPPKSSSSEFAADAARELDLEPALRPPFFLGAALLAAAAALAMSDEPDLPARRAICENTGRDGAEIQPR